jgi:hypothetical protein
LVKAYNIRRIKPEGLFLGNSRVDQGLDPHLASQYFKRNIYNAGLPGASIYEIYRYLQHAQAANPLQSVLVALDVFSFNTNTNRAAASYVDGRLLVDVEGVATPFWNIERIRDWHHVLVALPTVMKSLTTLADQEEGWVSTRTALGFNPMIEGDFFLRKEGYHASFARKDRNYVKRNRRRGMNFATTAKWPRGSMHYFSKIVEFCRRNGILLELIIHPYHAHVLEIMHETRVYPAFEAWKRQLVAILAADAVKNPGQAAYVLWDFSGYNEITSETVPPAEDLETKMRWYWESSHYKAEVGTMMGRRIYRSPKEHLVPKSFGVKLTPGNLEVHLQNIRRDRGDYGQYHRLELRELEALYRKFPAD